MQLVKNRKGLALGAIVSLVASLFGVSPANAVTSNNLTIAPSAGTSLVGLVTDDFALQVTMDAQYASSVGYSKLKYKITHDSTTFNLIATTSNTATVASVATNASSASNVVVTQSPLTKYVTPSPAAGSNKNTIAFRLQSGSATIPSSVSTQVNVTVVAFIDNVVENGELDSGEWSVTTTVALKPWSALGASVTLTQPTAGDTLVTASAAVSGVNFDQLDGVFKINFASTNDGAALASHVASVSAQTNANAAAGNMSASAAIAAASSSPVASLSAILSYDSKTSDTFVVGDRLAIQTLGVSGYTIDGVTFSPVSGVSTSGTATGDVRVNAPFTVRAYAYTGSVAANVASKLNWTTSWVLSSTQYVVVNGVTYTSSSQVPTTASPLTIAAGGANLVIQSFGLSGSSNTIQLQLNAQNKSAKIYKVTLKPPTFGLVNDAPASAISVQSGATIPMSFTVQDQWGAVSNRLNQRISASAIVGSTRSAVVTATVVDGKGSLTVVPKATPVTGSGTITAQLQTQDPDTGLWSDTGTAYTQTVYVTDASDAVLSRTASSSASISRIVSDNTVYSWSGNIAVTVRNSYSSLVVSAPGLVIKDTSDSSTASGTMTVVTTGARSETFQFAGTIAGTHVVTFTNGTHSTTSEIIISPAVNNEGTVIEMTAAPASASQSKTVTYTGVVKDGYGNVVDTTREFAGGSTASILVSVTGPGLVSGTFPTETDANGEFTFNLQTATNDEGTITVTVKYLKNGSGTATADVVSKVVTTTVAAPVIAKAQTVSVAVASSIEAGKNGDVTITVTDDAGKAHAYKTVVVYSTGEGYLNATTVMTDGDGKAVVKLITGSSDEGSATIFASVDGKSGSATTVVTQPAPPVVPEAAAVVGTFQGRWAVRVENAKGSTIVVKAGGNWYKYEALNDNYLFSRKSSVGASITVTVWIDGIRTKSEMVTIVE